MNVYRNLIILTYFTFYDWIGGWSSFSFFSVLFSVICSPVEDKESDKIVAVFVVRNWSLLFDIDDTSALVLIMLLMHNSTAEDEMDPRFN